MKRKIFSTDSLRIGTLILLLLNLLMLTVQTANARPSTKTADDYLKQAEDAIKTKKWVDAAIYYAIYFDRKSISYPANSSWKIKSQKKLNDLFYNARLDQSIAAYVRNKDLGSSCSPAMYSEYRETFGNKNPIPASVLEVGPAPDEVWVFTDPNFRGEWNSLSIGNYYTPMQMDMPDNSISSVMVGSDLRAHLCNDSYLGGDCMVFVPVQNQHPNLGNNIIGDNNVTSIRVVPKGSCWPAPDEVSLFMHIDYGEPCQRLSVGQYYNSNQFNLPDDSISSVALGSNVKAYLCTDNNLAGACDWFLSNDPWLGDNRINNDTLSSLQVEFKP